MDVVGYDVSEAINEAIAAGEPERFCYEQGIGRQLEAVVQAGHFRLAETLEEVVRLSSLLLLSPQTPHPPELDGSVRFNHARKDFDYSYLIECCTRVSRLVAKSTEHKTIVIISTVLPGTTAREIHPLMAELIGHDNWSLIYSPSFIAQSTIVEDFKAPEFCLAGWLTKDRLGAEVYQRYLRQIHDAPVLNMSWESAELAKVLYNTFIGFKIVLANTAMELCHHLHDADCQVVMHALQLATERIVSPRYMMPGMGDGGGCHPRDNIAMAFICEKFGLAYNPFDFVMDCREKQAEFLADLAIEHAKPYRPIVILGKCFKDDVNQTVGSPSVLLGNIITEEIGASRVFYVDDALGLEYEGPERPVYIIGVRGYGQTYRFLSHSTVIDPWGTAMSVDSTVTIVAPGRGTG
jgi:UDPglucose 6-dehydrogenase